MTYDVQIRELDRGLVHVEVLRDERALSVLDAIGALKDAELGPLLDRVVGDCPFDAVFWETPPVTTQSSGRAFEFILRDAPVLTRRPPNPRAFAEHFAPGDDVARFRNLGGDAVLVAPAPPGEFHHLAAFVREAPDELRGRLWSEVGAAVLDEIDDRPLWLNTSGAGVPWLHVRLDSRPKYYTHDPYRRAQP